MSEIVSSLLNRSEQIKTSSSRIGEFGEKAAAEYINRLGFRLVMSNFKVPVGRNRKGVQVTGEIDLIALDVDTLCFVEVKTRSSDEFASPLTAIDLRKQRQIIRTAKVFRKNFKLPKLKFRYDAISIVLNDKKAPKIEYFKGLWNENKFKKNNWADEYSF